MSRGRDGLGPKCPVTISDMLSIFVSFSIIKMGKAVLLNKKGDAYKGWNFYLHELRTYVE